VPLLKRAETLRTDGQNIDVRGAGKEVARRMGFESAIRECSTGEVGTRLVDRRGRAVASSAAGSDDSGGATAELEILRGELSRLPPGTPRLAHPRTRAGIAAFDAILRAAGVPPHLPFLRQPADGIDLPFYLGGSRRRRRREDGRGGRPGFRETVSIARVVGRSGERG